MYTPSIDFDYIKVVYINTVLVLISNAIVPVSYIMNKSYNLGGDRFLKLPS